MTLKGFVLNFKIIRRIMKKIVIVPKNVPITIFVEPTVSLEFIIDKPVIFVFRIM